MFIVTLNSNLLKLFNVEYNLRATKSQKRIWVESVPRGMRAVARRVNSFYKEDHLFWNPIQSVFQSKVRQEEQKKISRGNNETVAPIKEHIVAKPSQSLISSETIEIALCSNHLITSLTK